MKSLIQVLTLFIALFIIASCGPTQVATSSNPMFERDALYENSWQLVELNGNTITASGDRISYLTFTPGSNRISGYTSCNYLGGTLSFSGANGVSFSPIMTTDHDCVGNRVDVSLIPALRGVDSWAVVKDDLVMYDGNKIVARWAPSMVASDNISGSWQLSYINDHTMPFDVMYPTRPTLVIDTEKNIVSGNTGFNTYSCPVTIKSSGLTLAECEATKVACEGPGEAIYLKDLKKINNYTLADENTLVLFTGDNTVMKFTRIKS